MNLSPSCTIGDLNACVALLKQASISHDTRGVVYCMGTNGVVLRALAPFLKPDHLTATPRGWCVCDPPQCSGLPLSETLKWAYDRTKTRRGATIAIEARALPIRVLDALRPAPAACWVWAGAFEGADVLVTSMDTPDCIDQDLLVGADWRPARIVEWNDTAALVDTDDHQKLTAFIPHTQIVTLEH